MIEGMFDHGEIEAFFHCPYCGEQISMLLDLTAGGQSYIEDCEVCCQPIRLRYALEVGSSGRPEIAWLEAEAAQ